MIPFKAILEPSKGISLKKGVVLTSFIFEEENVATHLSLTCLPRTDGGNTSPAGHGSCSELVCLFGSESESRGKREGGWLGEKVQRVSGHVRR